MPGHKKDLIRLLPYFLQERVRYYFDFVKDRLYEESLLLGQSDLAKRYEDDVELIFLLRLLYGYFVLGFQNYNSSLEFFETLGADGFQIGTTHYSKESTMTKDWSKLASELITLVRENKLERYMHPNISTNNIIRDLLESFSVDADNGGSQDNL